MNKTIIGIDPGLNGGIAVIHNGKLIIHKMPEKFMDLVELFKPYSCGRASIEKINFSPMTNPFQTKVMEPLKENCTNLKNAMSINMIDWQEVAPATWIKFHNLNLPKGIKEKGIDYAIMDKLKLEEKHLRIHLSIERNVKNDVVIADNIKHILNTSGKLEARKMLCDEFTFFTKYDLNLALKQIEKEITKFKAKEKTIRKNRYKAKAQSYLPDGVKATLKNCDAILILLYEKYNPKIV